MISRTFLAVAALVFVVAILASSAAADEAPINTAPPSLVATDAVPDDEVGGVIEATEGEWSQPPASVSLSWLRCDSTGGACAPTGASASYYSLTLADAGKKIRVTATAHYDGLESGTDVSATSEASDLIKFGPPELVASPSVSGVVQEGQTLTADPGVWSSPLPLVFSYQWGRCEAADFGACEPVAGATGQTYTPGSTDVGMTLWVTVEAREQGDLASSIAISASAFTGVVAAIPLPLPSLGAETKGGDSGSEGGDSGSDDSGAGDDGTFLPPETTPLALSVDAFAASADAARAGKKLGASLRVRRSDTGAELESVGAVSCKAVLAGRQLEVIRRGWRRGAAECVWRVPARAPGKRIYAVIAVEHEGSTARKYFSVPVAR